MRVTRFNRWGNSLPGAVAVLWLMLGVAGIYAEDVSWDRATTAGLKAYDQGQYAEAARQFQAALAIAETLKPDDPRVPTSLIRLATVYHIQGQYAQAASLYQRALALQEQLLGPAHPQLVEVLEAYAHLQRRMFPLRSLLPWSTANTLAARARRIQEREERSSPREPPGSWSDYEEAAIFRDGS
jgi:tetratricopeptide (TPR) repeat protein